MSKSMVSLVLTSYNMGGEAREVDFDNWAAFVAERIGAEVGFEVSVDQFRFGRGPSEDAIDGSDEERETVREALRSIWDAWCEGEGGES